MSQEVNNLIKNSQHLVFMTGAGVSVPSGIPDYRSMTGVYRGIENPEYLLSHRCLVDEPEKFYDFVKQLYHPTAVPNIIHKKMAELARDKDVTVISQNIDGLHKKAGSPKVVNFHGSLYDCYCQKCRRHVPVNEYLESTIHKGCGGIIRPNVVLYEEGLTESAISDSVRAIEEADVIVIVGTSLKVYPFSGLVNYRRSTCRVIIVNKEKVPFNGDHFMIEEPAESFFKQL